MKSLNNNVNAMRNKRRIDADQGHISAEELAGNRPTIPLSSALNSSSSVPRRIRQKILDQLVDACIPLYDTLLAAYQDARRREQLLVQSCRSKLSYVQAAYKEVHSIRNAKEVAAEIANAANAAEEEKSLEVASLIENAESYLLTEEQLKLHDFPLDADMMITTLTNDDNESSVIKENECNGIEGDNGEGNTAVTERKCATCVRCNEVYVLPHPTNDDGCWPEELISQQCGDDSDGDREVARVECTYHPGRITRQRNSHGSGRTAFYSCCGDLGTRGCMSESFHVTSGREGGIYCEANASLSSGSVPCPILGVDCEMVYTRVGLELARVSVVDVMGNRLYDELVRPSAVVVDYLTRWSGITAKSLDKVTTTLADVQKELLSRFISRDTILVGHSLNSDLHALRLKHTRVIDTSVLYPHPVGLPIKYGLRVLAAKVLKRFVQQLSGAEEGHDSFEDAAIAVELFRAKAKKSILDASLRSTGVLSSRFDSKRRRFADNICLSRKPNTESLD